MDVANDMQVCLGLARGVAPEETGNLKFNAMSAHLTSDGFMIRYSLQNAFYIYFQEVGTSTSQKNKGFIGQRTVPLLAEYLHSKYSENDIEAVARFEIDSMYGNTDNAMFRGADYLRARQERLLQSNLAFMQMRSNPSMAHQYKWQASPQQDVPEKFRER